ncbi:MAG: hypothetical protein SOW29_10535, partial [Candidatus Faecousia sp.]|nr:hypothetical protein [Candidatus Faecousia sp.]
MIATGNHGYFDSLRGAPPQRGSQGSGLFALVRDENKKNSLMLFKNGNRPLQIFPLRDIVAYIPFHRKRGTVMKFFEHGQKRLLSLVLSL